MPNEGEVMRAADTRQLDGIVRGDLSTFFGRYGAVLEAAAQYVHRRSSSTLGRVSPSARWVSTYEVAEWIAKDLPTLYARSFGTGGALPLKTWRVVTMLRNASYLGAFEALDIRSVRGKGLATVVSPRRTRSLLQGTKQRVIVGTVANRVGPTRNQYAN
jgi:hypothetical protein